MRGKVESFKLDDLYIDAGEKKQIREAATSYFYLADVYTWAKPVLFITTGLVGTGKTTLAHALAKRLGLAVISSDVIRKQLAGVPLTEHRYEGFDRGIYSTEFSRRTYDKMFAEARSILGEGNSVILDASFIRRGERLKAKSLAEELNADFIILESILDDEHIKCYLAQRAKETAVSDGRIEILEPQKKQFDAVTEVPEHNHVIIDTSLPEEEVIYKTLSEIDRTLRD